jgi:hypothetical protein
MLGVVLWFPLATSMGPGCHSSHSQVTTSQENRTPANTNAGEQNKSEPKTMTGIWGGMHISLEVTDTGAEVSYDCAHGTVGGPIVPGPDGKFKSRGTHVKEGPGPTREGQDERGEPADYSGSIDGDTMTLTVTLPNTGETVGTFTLTKGARGKIRKCL